VLLRKVCSKQKQKRQVTTNKSHIGKETKNEERDKKGRKPTFYTTEGLSRTRDIMSSEMAVSPPIDVNGLFNVKFIVVLITGGGTGES